MSEDSPPHPVSLPLRVAAEAASSPPPPPPPSSSSSEGEEEPYNRAVAISRFYKIIAHFEAANLVHQVGRYHRHVLLRLTFEHAQSDASGDNFLKAFFAHLGVPSTGDPTATDILSTDADRQKVFRNVAGFADRLIDDLFLPLKAMARAPPPGTMTSRTNLLQACLTRHRHRCVVTGKFDVTEAAVRRDANREVLDDDGVLLEYDADFTYIELTHIIHPGLLSRNEQGELDPPDQPIIAALDMFDVGIASLIGGPIPTDPTNALIMSTGARALFREYRLVFEPQASPSTSPNTPRYRIAAVLAPGALAPSFPVPVVRDLVPAVGAAPPSPRLLALHRALGLILQRSGVGAHVDRLFEQVTVLDWHAAAASDGSTDLGRLVRIYLAGWDKFEE